MPNTLDTPSRLGCMLLWDIVPSEVWTILWRNSFHGCHYEKFETRKGLSLYFGQYKSVLGMK
jgi:hypothetical protein